MKQLQNILPDMFTSRKWLVELRGDPIILSQLIDNFSFRQVGNGQEPPYFLEWVYDLALLQSQNFSRFLDPKQVQKEGERILKIMNGNLKLKDPSWPDRVIEVGGVYVEELPSYNPGPILCQYPAYESPIKVYQTVIDQ